MAKRKIDFQEEESHTGYIYNISDVIESNDKRTKFFTGTFQMGKENTKRLVAFVPQKHAMFVQAATMNSPIKLRRTKVSPNKDGTLGIIVNPQTEIEISSTPLSFKKAENTKPRVTQAVSPTDSNLAELKEKSEDFSDYVPTKEEKMFLVKAGLGEKRILFRKNSSSDGFKQTVLEAFPKLEEGGGFELLRTSSGSRNSLTPIWVPPGGITSKYLSDESGLGQALCYIRPIQTDIQISEKEIDLEEITDVTEKCVKCAQTFPMCKLREHFENCGNNADEDTDLDEYLQPPKRKRQTPLCDFTCVKKSTKDENQSSVYDEKTDGRCPVCDKTFPLESLPVHAAVCGDSISSLPLETPRVTHKTLSDALQEMADSDRDSTKTWLLRVIRSDFLSTAMENLEEGDDDDWNLPIRINFIGEEGIDAGGLSREFFSLLFKYTPVFERNTFSLKSELLEKKTYLLMGKIVAKCLPLHPGPGCLNEQIGRYILTGKEPDFNMVKTEDLPGDVEAATKQIQEASVDNIDSVFTEVIPLLESSGFSKKLTTENKTEAINAIKAHFFMYRIMGPIHQFMDGLQFNGVLQLLRDHEDEAIDVFSSNCLQSPSSTAVMELYTPQFSKGESKVLEERVVYNFDRFLKKIEKSKINTVWIDPMRADEDETPITVNMRQVLQSLIGSPEIPRSLHNGILQFDHESTNLSSINTCLPSITFRNLKGLQKYEDFQSEMMKLVVEAYGFGQS